MKKIKIISAPGFESLQKNIDKWVDQENPEIKSVSAIGCNPDSLSHAYFVSILYSEQIDLGGE